ncbi:hypothetical protein [Streptomyces neyagawaensis]|uniref:hypothetical protein n=1 Tax=Streptomyces neyagawaensis TaxID=42238 RepID=UPI000AC489E8|nr:hypothetical protein [Streptomyces neyagawaensis]MCL6731743.1 hypothetical protein [Streptomyces neyagawaensis]MDE1683299.1 hypothetical protein [Streptomyces neyagawaensis]
MSSSLWAPPSTRCCDLAVLYAATIRPFDEIGLRTAVLAARHADVVLVGRARPALLPPRLG